jgi:acetylglutamate kinase
MTSRPGVRNRQGASAHGRPTRVIKIGGRAQGDSRLAALLAAAAAGSRLVVVHGGGDEVSAMQRRLGLEPTFVGGRRVTSPADLEVVRMLLSGTVNKRLVAQLVSAGARAVGLSGEDDALLSARTGDALFGRVGRDVVCDGALLRHLIDGGWLPVISPLARDRESKTGEGLNVNGDDAAAAVAMALGADELLFLADVDGVLENDAPVPALDRGRIDDLAARGVVQGGMRAKLEAALAALDGGVRTVRIGSLDAVVQSASGTFIVQSVPASKGHP